MADLNSIVLICAVIPPMVETAPPPKAVLVYYPTVVGTKWVMKGYGSVEVEYVVTESKQKVDGILVSVGVVKGKKVEPHSKVLVAKRALSMVEFKGQRVEPPNCFLRLPPGVDNTWKTETLVGDYPLKVTRICRGTELVEVPARRFKALRVDEERTGSDGKTSKVRCWYAPDVGQIWMEDDLGIIFAMKSFSQGKE